MENEAVRTRISPTLPLSDRLSDNLKNVKLITDNSSDVIIKTGMVCQNKIAVLTCEGMTSTDTLAELIYNKLNFIENKDAKSPEMLLTYLFEVYLTAAEQIEIKTLGELILKMQSGFAIILIDGIVKAIAIGIQGYKSRGVDEPSSELNVRGSREGFTEVIRTNMALIRR